MNKVCLWLKLVTSILTLPPPSKNFRCDDKSRQNQNSSVLQHMTIIHNSLLSLWANAFCNYRYNKTAAWRRKEMSCTEPSLLESVLPLPIARTMVKPPQLYAITTFFNFQKNHTAGCSPVAVSASPPTWPTNLARCETWTKWSASSAASKDILPTNVPKATWRSWAPI